MKTVAWYRVESRATVAELAVSLRSAALSQYSNHGYVVNSADVDKINATYVSRSAIKRVIHDIFGNEIVNDTLEYIEVDFELNLSGGYIEISSSRAGIRSLLANLSSTSNYRVGFTNMRADVLKWSSLFASGLDFELSLDKVLVKDLQYSQARGRLEITCDWKVPDIERNISSLATPQGSIERVRLRSVRPKVELRSILFDYSGFCRISASPDAMPGCLLIARQTFLSARI